MPDDKIIGSSAAKFRAGFSSLVRKLGLDPATRKPYGLRRGGATYHFRQLRNLPLTAARGRWRHHNTCKIYIDEAAELMARVKWSQLQLKAIEKGKALLASCVAK